MMNRSMMPRTSASRVRKWLDVDPGGRWAAASTARCVSPRIPWVPTRSRAASSSSVRRSTIPRSVDGAVLDGAVLEGRRQHDRGAGGDARDRADPGEQLLERERRGDADLEDVGLLAGHRPARLDLRDALEPVGVVVRL